MSISLEIIVNDTLEPLPAGFMNGVFVFPLDEELSIKSDSGSCGFDWLVATRFTCHHSAQNVRFGRFIELLEDTPCPKQQRNKKRWVQVKETENDRNRPEIGEFRR